MGILDGTFGNRFLSAEFVPPVDDGYPVGKMCEKTCFVACRVAASYHHDVAVLEERSVARGTVGNTLAVVFFFAGNVEMTVLCAGCHENRACLIGHRVFLG